VVLISLRGGGDWATRVIGERPSTLSVCQPSVSRPDLEHGNIRPVNNPEGLTSS